MQNSILRQYFATVITVCSISIPQIFPARSTKCYPHHVSNDLSPCRIPFIPCVDMAENSTTTYTTALGVWRRSGAVHISSLHDTKIASFPLDFLRSCGDHTWEYILFVVSLLIVIDADHPGQLHDDQDDLIDLRDLPTPGNYRYIERGPSLVTSSWRYSSDPRRKGKRCPARARSRIFQPRYSSFWYRRDDEICFFTSDSQPPRSGKPRRSRECVHADCV